jgi:hypothetical protein
MLPEAWDPVRACVEVMLGRLHDQAAAGAEIAQVEQALVAEVREIGRLGLQRFRTSRRRGRYAGR